MAKTLPFVDDTNNFENALNDWAETIVPGPGQVVVGGATGPQKVGYVPRAGAMVIPFGDSLMGANSSATVNGANDWPTMTAFVSDQFRIPRNAGIAGNTTAQMLARIQTDVIAYAPDACLMDGGTNDVPGVALGTIMANLTAMWDALVAANILPIICTVPPKDSAAASGEAARLAAATVIAAQARHLPVIDFFAPYANPATGAWQAGLSSDGTHPTAATALAMGQLAANKLAALFPPGGSPLTAAQVDAANLVSNGTFTLDVDGTPGLGDGWSWVGSLTGATRSITTGDTTISGNWQTVAVTSSGTRYFYQNITTGFAAGDVLEFSGRIRTSSLSGGMQVTTRLDRDAVGTGICTPLYLLGANCAGIFRKRATVPSGATKIIPIVLNTATGTGTFEAAQMTVRNLTALGLV